MFWFDDKANLENHRCRDWRQWGTFITYIYSVRRWKCKKKKKKKKKGYRKREWKKFISYGYKKLNNRPVETMRKSIITNVSQGCVFFVIQGLYFITSFNIPSVHPFLVLSLQISFSLIILFFLELSFLFLPNRKLLI